MTQLSDWDYNFRQICFQTHSGAMLKHLMWKHKFHCENWRHARWWPNLALENMNTRKVKIPAPGLSWQLLGSLGLFWELLGSPGSFWALLGLPGLSWQVLDSLGSFWPELGEHAEWKTTKKRKRAREKRQKNEICVSTWGVSTWTQNVFENIIVENYILSHEVGSSPSIS